MVKWLEWLLVEQKDRVQYQLFRKCFLSLLECELIGKTKNLII